MNLKQNSIEDLSRLCLKNSKSLENIREKVMRMSKLTSLDRSTVIPAAPLKQKVLESKGLSETKNGLPVCTDMIQDAFDSLSPQITSLNAKSTLKYLKSHHYQLQEHIEALESYIKYRDMPFSTIFRLESRLPIPKRLQAPDRKVELFVIGQNDDGQLGLSKELFMATTKFRKPSGVEEIETLACGSMHSVVVDKTGDVYTFGLEDCIGRDGVDDQINKLNLPSKALQVCCGEYFTAILDITGTVFYFGGFRNRNGKRLQLETSTQIRRQAAESNCQTTVLSKVSH